MDFTSSLRVFFLLKHHSFSHMHPFISKRCRNAFLWVIHLKKITPDGTFGNSKIIHTLYGQIKLSPKFNKQNIPHEQNIQTNKRMYQNT